MSRVEIYGFGSFFNGNKSYGDVDLLLLHDDRSRESCALAIKCKKELLANFQNLHITMLSKQAEQTFSFKLTAQAKYLGSIDSQIKSHDKNEIMSLIRAYIPTSNGVKKKYG